MSESENSGNERLCLDLFSGLGGFSEAFRESDGWRVVTVDVNPEFEPDVIADVINLRPSDLPEHFDVVLASPPCQYFTTIRNVTKGGDDAWTDDGRPATPGAKDHLALVYHTIGLIEGLAPDYWFMENPRGMLHKRIDVEPEGTIWYCQYGDENAKPTLLWGAHPRTFEYRTCYYGNDECGHTRTESYREHGGGSDSRAGILVETDPSERAKVPYGLSLAVREAVEEAFANPTPEQRDLISITNGGKAPNQDTDREQEADDR